MRVIVVGAGVVGLACAWALRKRGCDVLIVERAAPGGGCSAGNAGWICPEHAEPLPAPGLVLTSLAWMLRRDSPLYIAPSALPELIPFLSRFWRSCNARDFAHGLQAIRELSRGTQQRFDELLRDGVSFELHRDGLLCVSTDERALTRSIALHNEHFRAGQPPVTMLGYDEVHHMEPALGEQVVGGYLLGDEYHVRPESLVSGYVQALTARGAGIVRGTTVLGPAPGGVVTSAGTLTGDAVLVTAGVHSEALLQAFGVKVPMQAGKGYSITVPRDRLPLQRPLLLGDARVACTPFEGSTRVAGTLELSGFNEVVRPARLAGIRRSAARFFREPVRLGGGVEWVGLRPLTPDGLPLIGRVRGLRDVFVATGHAMLGVTLAPATGEHIADYITTGGSAEVLAPFEPARFGSRP
jgi:D-amino-acid dehydrogenase